MELQPHQHFATHIDPSCSLHTDPPCAWESPTLAHNGLPGGGGGQSPSDGLRGGWGDCKGVSTQNVTPSTDATKQNAGLSDFCIDVVPMLLGV